MATYQINGTSSKNNFGFYIIVDDNVSSIVDSTSVVSFRLYLKNNGTRTNSNNWNINVKIDNVDVYNVTGANINTSTVGFYDAIVIAQGSTTIYHNQDGTKTINVSAYISKSYYSQYDPGYCSLNGDIVLERINRVALWNNSTLALTDIENTFTLNFTNYVSNFTNVVTFTDLQMTTEVKRITSPYNGQQVTFTSSELSSIYTLDNNRNSNTQRLYANLYTYNNGVLVGDVQRMIIDAGLSNVTPTATYEVYETNENVITVLGGNQENYVVNNVSSLRFEIIPTAQKGATISEITVNGVNAVFNDNKYICQLANITTQKFDIIVVDSRGNRNSYTINKTLLDYMPVIINSFDFERPSQTSNNILLTANITYYDADFNGTQNVPILKYKIGEGNWITISNYVYEDNHIKLTNYNLGNILPYTDTATLYLSIEDLLTNDSENEVVLKGIPTFEAGEHDFQVNGILYVADENGENKVNILEAIINR